MKTRKMLAACLAALILLTGCQLAREEGAGDNSGDRLIGVLVTGAYLDPTSGQVFVDGRDSRYRGRLYATLKTRSLTDSRGEAFSKQEYVFDTVEGISYFAAAYTGAGGDHSYISSGGDEAISDAHTSMHYGDDEDKTTLEGTIYLSSKHPGGVSFINPVYQSPDGSVYAISGNGFSADIRSEGLHYSQTLEETTTITENGKSKSNSILIKISFAVMNPPEKIVVVQMDDANTTVSSAEYVPGELPSVITPEAGVAYIIVEAHKRDHAGVSFVSRTLYDKSNQAIDTFYSRDDGVCIKQWTQLRWSND